MTMISQLRTALAKRAAYNETRNAIRSMTLEVALDLDIYRPDANKIARAAVYG